MSMNEVHIVVFYTKDSKERGRELFCNFYDNIKVASCDIFNAGEVSVAFNRALRIDFLQYDANYKFSILDVAFIPNEIKDFKIEENINVKIRNY